MFRKKIMEMMKDEKGGPGLEEGILIAFVGLVVASASDDFGDVIASAYAKSIATLKTAFGIS